MKKIKIGSNVFIPMPMGIIGTLNEGVPNFMAAGWITRANANPPMLAVGINKKNLTRDCIMKTRAFSVNIPGREMLVETDYVGLVSGRKADKSKVFEVCYGDSDKAPLVKDAALSLECGLVQAVELPTNTLFVGEITGAWCDEGCLSESGHPDYRKMGAFLLTMPDNSYLGLGEHLGKAWSIGGGYNK